MTVSSCGTGCATRLPVAKSIQSTSVWLIFPQACDTFSEISKHFVRFSFKCICNITLIKISEIIMFRHLYCEKSRRCQLFSFFHSAAFRPASQAFGNLLSSSPLCYRSLPFSKRVIMIMFRDTAIIGFHVLQKHRCYQKIDLRSLRTLAEQSVGASLCYCAMTSQKANERGRSGDVNACTGR